ncbi:DUF7312 domain-containing protein [Halostella salina]|uniref:DUF7312 domain-containing protein n=1 Tax=Halostella salina TaxID=1547897 RepID=UPI000EF7CCDA|nr:hypothetical protein [Halostella salina]
MADDSASGRDTGTDDPGPDGWADDDPGPGDPASESPDDAEAEEWKFELDEVDDEGIVDEREAIEPGTPSLENAAFVVLGALVTVGIIVRVVMVFAP